MQRVYKMKMSIKQKRAIKWISIAVVLITFLALAGTGVWAKIHVSKIPIVNQTPKNVILLIGDGMGVNHIEAGNTYLNKDLTMTTLPEQAKVTTFSKIWPITDSAAAGSAMATGKKTLNNTVSQTITGKANQSITELAIEQGKKTGVISSKPIYDATPAAFSGHASNRKKTDTIIDSQIHSSIDLLMGEGKEEYSDYKEAIAENNKNFVTSFEDLPSTYNQPILFSVEEVLPTNQGVNLLQEMTKYALNYLSGSEKGFFLMVEGGKIDSKSHEKNFNGMLEELVAFDTVVKEALEFAKHDGNTLVIVVADHETGGLNIKSNESGVRTLDDFKFTSSQHTPRNVRAYFYPETVVPNIADKIDNTHIYQIMKQVITMQAG